MEIRQIQPHLNAMPEMKPAEPREPSISDSVTLGGDSTFHYAAAPPFTAASLSADPLTSGLFKSRETLWTSEWQGSAGISKGFIRIPGAGILAGTYCDVGLIGLKDGKTTWSHSMQSRNCNVSTSPAVMAQDGTILVGTTDGHLCSLDPATGQQKWDYKTDSYTSVPMQAPDGTIYVQKEKGIAALNADGSEKFAVPLDIERQSVNYVDSRGAVYVKSDNELYAIGPDGARLWQIQGRDIKASPATRPASSWPSRRTCLFLRHPMRPPSTRSSAPAILRPARPCGRRNTTMPR